jgi:hypothetical protein
MVIAVTTLPILAAALTVSFYGGSARRVGRRHDRPVPTNLGW